MEFRYLGNSGFKISEITFGNWLTHGSQVENEVATQCVRAALDAGISTFDTADVYANTAAETVLGKALRDERRESLEIFTKVFGPTGPKGHNDLGLSRKHIMEAINGSLTRLQTDYVDLYQAHRYDYETPLEETMQAFADIVRQGKALYIGVSEWTAGQIRDGHALAKDLGFQLISNQPQYSMLWRVIEAEVIPTSEELGLSQIVWSPIAQGVLSGKYHPGKPAPEGSRATDSKGGSKMIERWMSNEVLTGVQQLKPIAEEAGLTMAQLSIAWVLQNPNVASAIMGASRPEQIEKNVAAAGVKLDAGIMEKIDAAIGSLAERDPAQTKSPASRERVGPWQPRRRSPSPVPPGTWAGWSRGNWPSAGSPQRLLVRDIGRAPELAGRRPRGLAYMPIRCSPRAALDGVETLFMVSAAEAEDRLQQHCTFVDAAAAAGVQHIVYTSFFGAAADSTFTLGRDHFATEERIKASGMDYTFLRDNFYLDFLPLLAGEDGVIRGPAGDGVMAAVARADVARSAVTVLRDPALHVGRTYDLTGPEDISLAGGRGPPHRRDRPDASRSTTRPSRRPTPRGLPMALRRGR